MLEKSLKSVKIARGNPIFNGGLPICDSHIHLAECIPFEDFSVPPSGEYFCASFSHSVQDWKAFSSLNLDRSFVKRAAGVHPQAPDVKVLDFLSLLLSEGEIDAVGEAGFDLFTEEFKSTIEEQKKVFSLELELALAHKKPLVMHERKALHLVYQNTGALKKLPAVLFHSFFHGHFEAASILSKGVNAYFSFGKQILNGNRKALECVEKLPSERLLLETDAPFQTLRGEKYTRMEQILDVYAAVLEIRSEENPERFCVQLKKNFLDLYGK